MDNRFIGRLLLINGLIVETLQWSIDNKKRTCTSKLRTIAEVFAGVLADVIDRDAEEFYTPEKDITR